MNPDSVKRTDGDMHYRGVSSTHPTQARTRPDPLGPIVERYLLSGDEEAMDRLVERTRPKLMAVARRIGDPQDAEDAVQGAYMALVRKRGSGLDAPVMPWLLTTVIRLAYRRKAKQRRQRDLAAHLAQPREQAEGQPAGPAAPDQRALDEERDLHVRDSVARLPAMYRDAVVLRHLEGLSTRDTAALLDVPEATLRTRLHRAAKLLRSRMAPVVLGTLLFLPWCAADAVRRIVPITRPVIGSSKVLYATASLVLVGALTWTLAAPTSSSGSAAHRPGSTPTVGQVPGQAPPTPEPAPAAGADEPTPVAPDAKERTRARTEGTLPEPKEPRRPIPAANPADALEPLRTQPEPLPPIVDIASDEVELPQPPGMVRLEGGPVTIGTPRDELGRLHAGRPAAIRKLFHHEAPRHDVRVPTYWMARFEVTNAQYLRFLQDHTIHYTTRPGRGETLERLAGQFLSDPAVAAKERERRGMGGWRQLYEGNRGAIWRAFAGAGRDILVMRGDGAVIDLDATAERARREPLPAGLKLSFYRYRPPLHWPGLRPSADQMNHPVCYVSYNDAERMAEWAGMHVPTEAEWEWAARGAEGLRFPWGNEWVLDGSHANWGAKHINDQYEPTTLAVDTLLKGRSWCGLHHMCGNVAEWTSSWFRPYAGSDVALGKAKLHAYMGTWVKVIRGGSAADLDAIVLRSAVRNFVGAGPDAPPYPENAFRFVGFRLAVYDQPGRDQVGPVVRRAAKGHLKPGAFDPERYAAFVQRDWLDAETASLNHVYVRGRATAVVFVPVTYLLRESSNPRMLDAWKQPAAFRAKGGLKRRLRTAEPFFVAGVLHLDLPLEGVEVRAEDAEPQKRGTPRAPKTVPGRCEPGTYLVALWHGRVALTTPAREFVCFLPEPAGRVPSVEVRPRSAERLGPPTLKPSREADEGGLDFTVRLGGKRSGDKYVIRIRAGLPYAKDAFDKASARGAFFKSTDGR